jgi:hypothetical protein
MQTTRRSFMWIVLGAATAACSDGGVIKVQGDDGGGITDGGVDSAALADSAIDASGDASTARTFVGNVQGIDARVGLVVEGPLAFVFFCGGPNTYATATKWFRGSVSLAAPFSLQQTGWTAAGALQSDGVTINGTLDRGGDAGTPLTWSATEVSPATAAGLYEATDTDGVAALIVEQPMPTDTASLQGAFKTTAGGVISQVVPLMPVVGGFKVQVTVGGVMKELIMTRSHPK